MGDKQNPDAGVPFVMRKAVIYLVVGILVLILLALSTGQYAVKGNSDRFVKETVDAVKEMLENNDSATSAKEAVEISKKFEDELHRRHFWIVVYETSVHLVVAGIVALILIFFVERQIRKLNQNELSMIKKSYEEKLSTYREDHDRQVREYKESVSRDVWRAVFSRLVPKEITQQLENIVRFDFVKRNVMYRITIDRLPGEVVDGRNGGEHELVLVKREIWFALENISGRAIPYPFRCKILVDADMQMQIHVNMTSSPFGAGKKVRFPRHHCLKIDGNNIDLPGREEVGTLEEPVELPIGRTISVHHAYYEILRVSDQTYFLQKTPVLDLEVMVMNRIPDRISVFDVFLAHPERESFIRVDPPPDERWTFDGRAILPGQMFAIRWKPVDGNTRQTEGDVPESGARV